MKIIRNISDNYVVLLVSDNTSIQITDNYTLINGDTRIPNINSSEYEVVNFVENIEPFSSKVYKYTDKWEFVTLTDDVKQIIKNKISTLRKEKQAAGITVLGSSIDTDAESLNMISSAFVTLEKNYNGNTNFPSSIEWKTKNNEFLTVDYSSMESIASATSTYVEGCFSAEKQHFDAINALANVTDANNYDYEQFWPSDVF